MATHVKSTTTQKLRQEWRRALMALLLSLCTVQIALADDWNLKDTNGVHYKLSEQKGKWVLVNFWAPWCPECLQEIAELNALQKHHKDIQVIGVAVMYRKNQEVTEAARAQSISYPVVLGNEDIASDFGEMKGMPTSFLYSPSGNMVGRHDGPLTQNDVEQAIAHQPNSAELFSH
jgi:thiol-disulfide isomerase/thioredoxin